MKNVILPIVRDKVSSSQFAYLSRPGSGTTSALVLTQHKILEYLDVCSGAVRVLSVDFSKAFDKLLHSRILSSCELFQIPRYMLEWISSFLSLRKQRVILDQSASPWSLVSSGVPQGSVLGPILFCLAVDDLQPVCDNTSVIKYADDVTFFHFIRNSCDDALQREWDHLEDWSRVMHLPLNFLKCKVMNVITKKALITSLSPIHSSDGHFIDIVNSMSFLGVTFCENLKWNSYFDKIVKKACKRLFIMYNLRRSRCSPDILFRCYSAFIRPLFLYGFPCFCNAPDYLIKIFLSIERRIFRIIGPCHNFRSFLDVAEDSSRKLMCRIELNRSHPLRGMFDERSGRSLRTMTSLRPPRAKTTRFKNSFIKFCR